jgi:hypothetical protein
MIEGSGVFTMSLCGKSEAKKKPGRYRCKDCGAVSKKKGRLCNPKKIKKKKQKENKE